MKLPGITAYRDLTLLRQYGDTLLVQGTADDGGTVTIKTHAQSLPTDITRERLRREFLATTAARHRHLASARELIDEPSRAALVLDDPGGQLLTEALVAGELGLLGILAAAIDLTDALVALHLGGLVHGAVDSDHVVVVGEHGAHAGEATLIDLYDACPVGVVARRSGHGAHPAPEQHGRTRRPADPATDQFGLAATIERCADIAGATIPDGLAAVLQHARCPDPAQRYPSMLGLAADLRRCKLDLEATGTCSAFPTGSVSTRLTWRDPSALIGREDLLDHVEGLVRQSGRAGTGRVILVRGQEGSGRTAFLAALCDRLAEAGVVTGFASFDPSGSDPPLRAPIEALHQVVSQMLAAPEAMVDSLRSELRERLGDDAAFAAQILPALVHLLGPLAPPIEAAPGDLIALVERAVLTGIGSIARHAAPLVMVLDDADRADAASLRTLRLIARHPELGATVSVLATESDRTDALEVLVDELRERGLPVDDVMLEPIRVDGVAALIAQGAGTPAHHMGPLAEAVWERSGGIPQLVVDDVWRMISAGEFGPDPADGRWHWTDAALERSEPASLDSAAALRLVSADDVTHAIVGAVALCERAATTGVLATALQLDPNAVSAAIATARALRLTIDRDGIDGRRVVSCADGGVRRGALASFSERTRTDLQHRLATALLAEQPSFADGMPQLSDDLRFEIVRLLTAAQPLIHDPAERKLAVSLYEDAARVAHRSAGFQLALDLQRKAIALLGEGTWTVDQPRMFDLHIHAAEHALLIGETELVDGLIREINSRRPTPSQRVRTLRVMGSRWWTRQDAEGGLAELRDLMRELGEPIPDKPTWTDVAREFVAVRLALRGVDPESFLERSAAEDERVIAVNEAMTRCLHLAYISEPITHIVLSLRGVRITARSGLTTASGYFLASYGLLCCGFHTDVDRGLRFGKVGMQLATGTGGTLEPMVGFAYNVFVRHWGEPLAATIEPLVEEFHKTLAIQQQGYGMAGATFAALHGVLSGRPLHSVDEMAEGFAEDFARLDEHAFKLRVDLIRQTIHDLRTGDGTRIVDGGLFSSSEWFAVKPRRNELALIVHTLRGFEAMCLGNAEVLRESVDAGARLLRTAPGQVVVSQHRFHAALVDADAAVAATDRQTRSSRRRAARKALRWLRKWNDTAPHVMAHRIALVEALLAQAAGDVTAAMERFEAAVALATTADSLPDLAVAAERAASFHETRAGTSLARHYATLAHDAFQAWGAAAAAAGLRTRHPSILATAARVQPAVTHHTQDTPSGRRHSDAPTTVDTLAQAGILMGRQLEVHEFLDGLLEIVLRHADATRGFLVLDAPDGPLVEAAARRVAAVVDVDPIGSRALADHPELCIPAVSYALRTQEVLALVDPATDRRFRSDVRLRIRSPRAMLCLPIGREDGTSGVLVLESDTFSHAFDADSIEALRVLSAQAISAIENVRLSSDLSSLTDDVAGLRATAAALTMQAETDPLTGAANRAGLRSGFQSAMRALLAAERGESDDVPGSEVRQIGVLFCDLDGFKSVNDRHGHSVGDAVLVEVADRLRRVVRTRDIVARVGGDEFVVVSVDVPTSELIAISERALQDIGRPMSMDGGITLEISASIGVARADIAELISPDDIDAVLEIADEAMYRAKNAGKNRVVYP